MISEIKSDKLKQLITFSFVLYSVLETCSTSFNRLLIQTLRALFLNQMEILLPQVVLMCLVFFDESLCEFSTFFRWAQTLESQKLSTFEHLGLAGTNSEHESSSPKLKMLHIISISHVAATHRGERGMRCYLLNFQRIIIIIYISHVPETHRMGKRGMI